MGELVYRLVKAAGATVTPEMATCLYTTVLTDTGGFMLRLDAGFDVCSGAGAGAGRRRPRRALRRDVYLSTPTSKMLLLGAALSNLKREGRLAWLWVTHQDMVRTCAAEEDCEGIVNFAHLASRRGGRGLSARAAGTAASG